MTQQSYDRAMPWRAFVLTWLGLATLLILISLSRISGHEFTDPDDFMRLVQVRDLLDGQGWFDLTQYRLDPPLGTPMHWSRLVDVPLALVILVLKPLLGAKTAETAALVIVPLLTLGCVAGLAMRIATRWLNPRVAVMAGVCTALVPATLAQLIPLRIDHHGWQIACVMWAAASPVLVRNPLRAAALAGLAFALSLSISIEALPIAAGYGAILAWGWLMAPDKDRRLAAFMTSLALGLEVLFLATRGPAAVQPWCDAIAPAHIVFFLIAATGITLASRFGPARRGFVLLALGLSGALAAAVFARITPACLGAPFGALDPLVMKYWYANIAEGNPVWQQPLEQAAFTVLPVLAALAALLRIRHNASGADRKFWSEYLLLFLAAMLTGILVWRSIAFAGALGAVGLGWLLNQILVWAQHDRTAAQRGELPKRYLALAAAIAGLSLLLVWPSHETVTAAKPSARLVGGGSGCNLPYSTALLDRLPSQIVFAPLDIAPTILATSRHSVVASSHHRANLAIRDVMLAFLSDQAKAQQIVLQHRATLLVICSDVTEPSNYAHDAPRGLMADLQAGRIPVWLYPVDLGQPKALRIYRVIRQP